MNRHDAIDAMTCDAAQDAIQARRDGELAADDAAILDAHLLSCDECREHESALGAIGDVLCSLPDLPMPPEAVTAVLAQADAAPSGRRKIYRILPWSASGIAAALLFAMFAGPFAQPPSADPPISDAEVAQAASEAEYVLALAGRVLARVEQETFQQVLGEHVSPALDHIPFRFAD